MAKLTFVLEDGQEVVVSLEERISLGREDGNDVVVDDSRISAWHAELIRGTDGRFEVCDLKSKAGTFVNGERVERKAISSGDRITFGPLTGYFQMDDGSAPASSNGSGAATEEKPVIGRDGPKEIVSKPGRHFWQRRRERGGHKEPAAEKPRPPENRDRTESPPESTPTTQAAPATRPAEAAPQVPTVSPAPPAAQAAPAPGVAPTPAPPAAQAAPAPVVPDRPVETQDALAGRLAEGHRKVIEDLTREKARLQGEVDVLHKSLREWQERARQAQDAALEDQRKSDEVRAALAQIEASARAARAQHEQQQTLVREATDELGARAARLEQLRAEEARLAQISEGLRDAKATHAQWLERSRQAQDAALEEQRKIDQIRATLAQFEAATKTARAQHDHQQARLRETAEELSGREAVLEKLRAEESRLARVREALRDAESAHAQWLERASQAQAAAQAGQRKVDEVRATLAQTEAAVKAAKAQHEQQQASLRELANEVSAKGAKIEKLRAEETRLAHVTDALREAESSHGQWIEAIRGLSAQHEAKNAEVQRLTTSAQGALREIETVTARQREVQAQFKRMGAERDALEAQLAALRRQVAEFEARRQEGRTLAEAREDQVKAAEARLAHLEEQRLRLEKHIKELTGIEKALEKILADCKAAEARRGELNAELTNLGGKKDLAEKQARDLESHIKAQQEELRQVTGATQEARAAQQKVEEVLKSIHAERTAHEQDLAEKRRELITEMQRLDETKAKRAEIAQQCEELADTGRRLAETREEFTKAVARRDALVAQIGEIEAERDRHKGILDELCSEEEEAKDRVAIMRGREKDLRSELERLGEAEASTRLRFEEARRLTLEAEKGHAAQKEELQRNLEIARRELADMEVKLAPLREWKESMDKRYARLAALPEDSAEARELWKEIESEKSSFKGLATATPGQTRGVSLKEVILRGFAEGAETTAGKGRTPATPDRAGGTDIPAERPGSAGSGSGQEIALNARMSRLRESVQREAMRLEFLRQERAREETRMKSGSSPEPAMREQGRQIESKIRREEERLATVQRKLELVEIEEGKRREKIAEMERRLAELRTDIAEAERQRSDLRHHADIVQTELKNYEAALDRVKKMAE